MTSYALDELTWPEVGRILARDPRLMLAVGALEQYGPHLPLGANLTIAQAVTARVSQEAHVLRAPPFWYGVTTGGGPYPGRSGLGRKTLHRAVNELLARWEDDGVEEFILVTAHRFEPHLEALLMALSAHSTTSVFDLYQIDVEDLVSTNPEGEHAGELETSLLLYLEPESVRGEEVRDFEADPRTLQRYTRGRMPTPPGSNRGAVGRPSLATGEKGEALFKRYVASLAAALGGGAAGTAASPDV